MTFYCMLKFKSFIGGFGVVSHKLMMVNFIPGQYTPVFRPDV